MQLNLGPRAFEGPGQIETTHFPLGLTSCKHESLFSQQEPTCTCSFNEPQHIKANTPAARPSLTVVTGNRSSELRLVVFLVSGKTQEQHLFLLFSLLLVRAVLWEWLQRKRHGATSFNRKQNHFDSLQSHICVFNHPGFLYHQRCLANDGGQEYYKF